MTQFQLSIDVRDDLFLTPALLQGAGVVILDESFGALYPDQLKHAMHLRSKAIRSLDGDCARLNAAGLADHFGDVILPS